MFDYNVYIVYKTAGLLATQVLFRVGSHTHPADAIKFISSHTTIALIESLQTIYHWVIQLYKS